MSPDIDDLIVPLSVRDQALRILLLDLIHLALRLPNEVFFLTGNVHVVDTDRQSGFCRVGKADILDLIQKFDSVTMTGLTVDRINELGHLLLRHELIRIGEWEP